MSVKKFPASIIDLIKAKLIADLPGSLAALTTQEASDGRYSTAGMVNYYTSEVQAFQMPACFILCDSIEFRKEENQANSIRGIAQIDINIVCSDRREEILTRRSHLYLAAAHSVLDQNALLTTDNNLKCLIRVDRATFSPIQKSEKGGDFAKEVILSCSVEFYENF